MILYILVAIQIDIIIITVSAVSNMKYNLHVFLYKTVLLESEKFIFRVLKSNVNEQYSDKQNGYF